MKSVIRIGILMIALICYSNMTIAQKKNKKKAKTTIGIKKKQPRKKLNTKKKQSSKKVNKKKKQSIKKVGARKLQNTRASAKVATYNVASINDKLNPIPSITNNKYVIDSIPEKVVTIVSAFKPQLKNVAKIGFINATAIVDTNTVILSYQVPSQNLSFQYQPIALVPRAIKIDSIHKFKQAANLKIGIGNYFNQIIQIDASYEDLQKQQHHISILNESIAGSHPIQKWNGLGFNYNGVKSMNKNKQLHTQFYFNQSNRYRYGLVPDSTILPLNNFEQKLTVVGANFSLANKQVSFKPFNYAPILIFNHSNLLNQANHISFDLKSSLSYRINRRIKLHNDFSFSYNQYNPNNRPSTQNTILQLNPSFEINNTAFKLNLGIQPTFSNGDFTVYPKIEITKQLKDTNIVLDAGWNTNLMSNQLMQLIGQNHWISAPNGMPVNSIEKKYINVQVTVNKRLHYGFNLALNDYRELPFFNQSKLKYNPIQEGLRYDVLFEKRATAIELIGELRYQFSDKLLWKNHFKYIQFNLIRENTQAWGILPFEFNAQLNWVLNSKIQMDASGQFWTGAKTSSSIGNAYKLNNTFVLNAGMQYAFTDHWTFWGKAENLLDQQYQRWANYPSLGVQLVAGIQYKFKK